MAELEPTTPMTNYKDARAVIKAIQGFMQALNEKDFVKALEHTQKTWVHENMLGTAKYLEDRSLLFTNAQASTPVDISHAYILRMDNIADVLFTLKIGSDVHMRMAVRVIRERGPHQPHTLGAWGVDPISLRNVKATE